MLLAFYFGILFWYFILAFYFGVLLHTEEFIFKWQFQWKTKCFWCCGFVGARSVVSNCFFCLKFMCAFICVVGLRRFGRRDPGRWQRFGTKWTGELSMNEWLTDWLAKDVAFDGCYHSFFRAFTHFFLFFFTWFKASWRLYPFSALGVLLHCCCPLQCRWRLLLLMSGWRAELCPCMSGGWLSGKETKKTRRWTKASCAKWRGLRSSVL